MLDPVSQELLKFMPTAGEYFLSDGNLRNFVGESFIKNLEKRLTVRLDHQINSANRLSGRYTQVPIRGDRGRGDFQIGRDEINTGGTDYSWSKQILLTDTHIFSPKVVNELRLNYTFGRFTKNFPPMFDALTGRNFSTEIGLPSLTPGGLPEFTTGAATDRLEPVAAERKRRAQLRHREQSFVGAGQYVVEVRRRSVAAAVEDNPDVRSFGRALRIQPQPHTHQ